MRSRLSRLPLAPPKRSPSSVTRAPTARHTKCPCHLSYFLTNRQRLARSVLLGCLRGARRGSAAPLRSHHVFRRLVARVLAQHFADAFQDACLPHQFGLSTRAGAEGLYKLLHTATALDPRATVLSVDAIGAFDHVSRHAMLEGLRSRPALEPLLPFARQFYGCPSVYTWLDDDGREHDVLQGEGGEQGDPLMSALYCVAQHAALAEVAAGLRDGEVVFAFLDDTYVVSRPERTGAVHGTLQDALWRHAGIRLHAGKTRVWNIAGEETPGVAHLQTPGADFVWTGAWTLPPAEQGLLALGAPLGSEAFVQRELSRRREMQDRLLGKLPTVSDLHCAPLAVRRRPAGQLPAAHSLPEQRKRLPANMMRLCATALPRCCPRARSLCCRSPPVSPCTCRCDTAAAAYWASWLTVYQPSAREPPTSPTAWLAPCRPGQTPPRPFLPRCLRMQGFEPPAWGLCSARRHNKTNESLVTFCRDGSGLPPLLATSARWRRIFLTLIPHLERCCCRRQGRMPLGPSQSSPRLAKSPVPSGHFRVLLLRRLRLPLPVAPRTCACRGHLHPLADHRAACATSGVLASRALPLERAVARVFQEAGARVARNVRLADLNIDVPVSDDRRVEALWHGSQQAVDATVVSPVARAGDAQPGAAVQPGKALEAAARRKRRQTYPESSGSRSVAALAMKPPRGYVCWRSTSLPPFLRRCGQRRGQPGLHIGRACWQLPRSAHLPRPSSSSHLPASAMWPDAPELHEVLADVRWQLPVPTSRQGPR